jgi:hypothetical protein
MPPPCSDAVLPLTALLARTERSPPLEIPPPKAAVFPLIVLSSMVSAPPLRIPPPSPAGPVAVLFVMVEDWIVAVPPVSRPPPLAAEFPLTSVPDNVSSPPE